MPLHTRRVLLQIAPSSGPAVELEGLRIRFRVKRHVGKLDGAQLDVWGLALDTYGQIARSDTVTRLVAGYVGSTGELLQGTTVAGSLRRVVQDGEVVTTWQVQEAAYRFAGVILSASWQGSVTATELLDYVADAVGLSRVQQALPRVPTYARGYVLSGSARDALRALAADCGCSPSVQSARLVLVPLDGSPARVRGLVLAPDSGLLGWPEQSDKGRVRVRSLLQPGLLPGDAYRVGGSTLTGDYVAEEVEHAGDSGWAEEYETVVTGRPRK